jgi:hypothetical protein
LPDGGICGLPLQAYSTERVYALLAKAPAVGELVERPALLAFVD